MSGSSGGSFCPGSLVFSGVLLVPPLGCLSLSGSVFLVVFLFFCSVFGCGLFGSVSSPLFPPFLGSFLCLLLCLRPGHAALGSCLLCFVSLYLLSGLVSCVGSLPGSVLASLVLDFALRVLGSGVPGIGSGSLLSSVLSPARGRDPCRGTAPRPPPPAGAEGEPPPPCR